MTEEVQEQGAPVETPAPSMEETLRSTFEAIEAREAAEPAEAETPDQPLAQKVETAEPSIDPPASWSADVKAKWTSLPPDLREYIAKREGEVHGKITQQGKEISALRPYADLTTRYRETFERRGLDPVAAIEKLFQVQMALDKDPAAVVQQIAKAYGVKLGGEQPVDPVRKAVEPLEREVNALKQERERERRAAEEAARAEAQSSITSFAKDRPHFEAVRRDMALLMAGNPKLTLEDAYDRAVYANPETRRAVAEAEAKAKADEQAKAAAEKAAKAKSMAKVNTGNGRAAAPKPKGSWMDTLRETADEIMSRS